MKTAVDAVFTGKERRFNSRFQEMCSHYVIDPVACTPASGWGEPWCAIGSSTNGKRAAREPGRLRPGQHLQAAPEAATLEALEDGTAGDDVIINIIGQRRREPPPPDEITASPALALVHTPVVDCAGSRPAARRPCELAMR